MPPLPPVPNVVKCIVAGSTPVNNWVNVFHAGWSGTVPTEAILGAMATDLYNVWCDGAGIISLQTADSVIESVELIDLTTSSGAGGISVASTAGSNGEDPLPGNVCTLISTKVDTRYRGGHGRYYLNAGGDGNLLDMSHWNSGYVSEANAAVDQWFTELGFASSGGCSLTGAVVVSYVNKVVNPTPPYRRTTPVVMSIVPSSWTVDAQLASQRRRIGRK